MKEPQASALIAHGLVHQELFPIREVSRLTGVNPVTLRAWERRYGLIQPTRTESGHRLYSQADIDAIDSILGWLRRGVAVSKVGSILARSQGPSEGAWAGSTVGDRSRWQAQVREAVRQFDAAQLGRLFEQVFASHALEQVFGEVFMPVWQALRASQAEYGQASEWLFLDQFLRARVLLRLQLAREPKSRRILLSPLSAQGQELELLVAGLLLGSDEVAVTVLAPGQPVEELALVCERLAPDALVLFDNHRPASDLDKRLARLAQRVNCPLLLAGETAEMAQDSLEGGPVGCLGAHAGLMKQRLRQFLAGQIET